MKKKILSICIIVLVLVLALFSLTACDSSQTEYDTELIQNGTFEKYSTADSGKITFDGWEISSKWDNSSYTRQPLSTSESEDETLSGKLGTGYLGLTNDKGAAVYLSQSVKVDRRAVYKVSVDIRLKSDITKGSDSTFKGAFVTFLENVDYVFAEQTVAEGWVTLTFYVRPVNTDYMTIALSLGKDGANCKGTVYFDNASMMKVDSSALPEGTTVTDFRMSQIARYNRDLSGILFVTMLSLFGVALIVGAYVGVRKLYARSDVFVNFDGSSLGSAPAASAGKKGATAGAFYKNCWFVAVALMLGTFLVRLVFLLTMYGFGGEMNFSVNLAKMLAEQGVTNIYASQQSALATVSPGTLYILAIIGAMGQNLTYDGISVLIRMVGVLADMAVVAMIYFYGRKYAGDKLAVLFAALYSLLPVVFVMSGLANTFESLLVALVLGAMLLLVEKKYLGTYLVMTLAVLLDIRAMALVPVALVYMGYMYYRDDSDLRKFGKNRAMIVFGLIGAFALLYVLTLPVAVKHLNENAFYGIKMIANQMLNNNIFVDNAFGFYGMVALNQKGFSNTASVLNLLFILILVIYICSLYFKKRNRQEVLLLASYTFAMIATFTLKVTYTYLFMSIALAVVYIMVSGEKRMYWIAGGYSFLSFLCVGLIIKNSGYAAVTSTGYIVNFETTGVDFILFSVLTVLLSLYYSYVVYSITNSGKIADIKPLAKPLSVAVKDGFKSVSDVFKSDKK